MNVLWNNRKHQAHIFHTFPTFPQLFRFKSHFSNLFQESHEICSAIPKHSLVIEVSQDSAFQINQLLLPLVQYLNCERSQCEICTQSVSEPHGRSIVPQVKNTLLFSIPVGSQYSSWKFYIILPMITIKISISLSIWDLCDVSIRTWLVANE